MSTNCEFVSNGKPIVPPLVRKDVSVPPATVTPLYTIMRDNCASGDSKPEMAVHEDERPVGTGMGEGKEHASL